MKTVFVAFLIVLIILAVIFMPFATIWAINTLFGTSIGYTFWTWLSVVVLNLTVIGGQRAVKSN